VIHVVQQPTHEAKWAQVKTSYWNAAKSEGILEVLVAYDSRMGESISGYHRKPYYGRGLRRGISGVMKGLSS
jgi:hypothetical protein